MTYGVQMFNSAGVLRLDIDETFTRVVDTVKLSATSTGTVSVPDFDSARGMLFVNYFVNKFDLYTDTALADSYSPMRDFRDTLVYEPTSLPSLSWNNTTKLLSYSPVVWPSGWTRFNASDYMITFIHYR